MISDHDPGPVLETARLVLRGWRDADLAPFAGLNADPSVMRHFPALLSEEESATASGRIRALFREQGFGLWAVEVKGEAPFAGFVGLHRPGFQAHFTPCVEIGWRLAERFWNRGLATEAARAALAFGFGTLGFDEIVAMAVVGNRPSRRVMDKIGMTHDASDDFDHPLIAEGHPLRRHVLYRVRRPVADAGCGGTAPL
jgi:RimJ/RimL family protein N-acetyltransferase